MTSPFKNLFSVICRTKAANSVQFPSLFGNCVILTNSSLASFVTVAFNNGVSLCSFLLNFYIFTLLALFFCEMGDTKQYIIVLRKIAKRRKKKKRTPNKQTKAHINI